MPRDIEIQTLGLQSLLRTVIDQNSQGRPLTAEQWRKLQVDVAKFKGELDRVDYAALISEDYEPQENTENTEGLEQSFARNLSAL